MTPELQTVVDRLELVEKQNRGLRALCLIAGLLAAGAIAIAVARPEAPVVQVARHSVVEANRFLLRDAGGRVSGGMEVDRDGTIKLVLGRSGGETGAAFLEVRESGAAHLTLRGPDGGVRAAVLGTRNPSVSLTAEGQPASAARMGVEDGAGSLFLADARGRTRFRAP